MSGFCSSSGRAHDLGRTRQHVAERLSRFGAEELLDRLPAPDSSLGRVNQGRCDSEGPREQRDDVRDAQINIFGVVFFVIDPPSSAAEYDFKSPGELWILDSYETRSIPEFTKTIDKKLLDAVPADAFVQSFFMSEWNSYLHVAAAGCAMKWVGVARHYAGVRQAFYPSETVDL